MRGAHSKEKGFKDLASRRRHRREFLGTVISDRMTKTRVVEIVRLAVHPKYGKVIRKRKRVKAHDEENRSKSGDQVRIVECRPLSRDKRWRVSAIVRSPALPEEALEERSSAEKQAG